MGKNDINTEQRILEAAKTVFMQYGVYGARMQEIANTAGINKALLHYYFRSKEKLFDAVFEGALEKYFNQMNVLSDESLPLIQRIHGYIHNIFAFYKEYPQMSLFIIKEITVNPELFRQKVQSIKQTQGPLLITALKESVQKGELQDFDPLTFLVNLHSLCTYPFLAAPIFKVIADKNGEQWSDESLQRVQQSVKDFVSFKFNA